MIRRPSAPGRFRTSAAVALGLLLASSCNRKSGTPDWNTSGNEPPAPATSVPPPQPATPPLATSTAPKAAEGDSSELRFLFYNVENWLTMDRFVDNQRVTGVPKPDSEKTSVVALMARHRPDIVGLCEIGTREDLQEIQNALRAAGIDLPHLHHAGGSDPVRHLGLLSRFPITATAAPAETSFKIEGVDYSFNRSVLDATVDADGRSYRFLGVHLKSKREVENGDQELMRQGEARLLRKHVDSIFDADANARLVVYGDVNDTRPSPSFRTITGNYNDPRYLTAVPARDSRGDAWTHHWKPHDIYSRIDFVTVSRSLRSEVDFDRSYVVDDAEWSKASDHRPIVVIFR
jgi:endonuclease/exonuclease/phosphatase family metal-dependent hydrolase